MTSRILLPPKVQSHAQNNLLLDKHRPHRQSSHGTCRAYLAQVLQQCWLDPEQSLVWDSDKTHMATIQEMILLLSHWANYRYDVKFRGPLQPDLYVELQKRAPLPDPSMLFRDRFLHIILSVTMQQITHYPALSCLIMSPLLQLR